MSYKTILIHVQPSPASEARLQAAVKLAEKLQAELVGVGGREPLIAVEPLAADFGGAYGVEACAEADARLLAEAEASFHKLAPGAIWRPAARVPTDALCDNAAGADLVIVGLEHVPRDFAPNPAETVLRAGLPVIALPVQHSAIAYERILIAWKDTREARRAVSDALPLLQAANEVTVVSISTRSETAATRASVDNLMNRLARHGVMARAEFVSTRGDPGDGLVHFVASRGADLIVAGAFGRSRAGEWLLGGVTQTLLEQSSSAVLFSH